MQCCPSVFGQSSCMKIDAIPTWFTKYVCSLKLKLAVSNLVSYLLRLGSADWHPMPKSKNCQHVSAY